MLAHFENKVDLAPRLCQDGFVMQGWAHNLVIWVAILVPIFTSIGVVFLVLFMEKSGGREDYLKRVARKYSVPPLNLR